MRTLKLRLLSVWTTFSLLIGLLTCPVGWLAVSAADVTVVQNFENGTDGFSAWMVDSNATWSIETQAPLSGTASLNLRTANIAGCYVNFPAAVGTQSLALRLKVSGKTGIVRIGANGSNAHYKRSESSTGYEELTTSAFVFTDTDGNVLSDVAVYDAPWGGLRFGTDFDGYVFIKNEKAVDIHTINVGIFHGSTNAEGMTLLLDDFAAYFGADYADVIHQILYPSAATTVQDFEGGAEGFSAWLVESNATWKLDKIDPLGGTASLRLATNAGVGCYVNFPAEAGTANLAVRLKVSASVGVVRIGANGASAHYKNSENDSGYYELTTTDIVFTDVNGNVLSNAAVYDTPWGGIRFNGAFDGYVFLRNEKAIDIRTINVGIFHGSTTQDGMALVFDNFATYSNHTANTFAAVAATLNQDVPLPTIPMLPLGLESIPAGTKDALISDDFAGTALNSKKWQGTATVRDGVAQIPAAGILSQYRQKATADKPLLVHLIRQSMGNGAGLALYGDTTHYGRLYYENGVWYWATCVGGAEQKTVLHRQTTTGGGSMSLVYDGSRVSAYINGQKVADLTLPSGWDGARLYHIKLTGEMVVSDLYVAGGAFTAQGKDEGMSDDFSGSALDADKWEVANVGYMAGGAVFDHPGTLLPTVRDGRLVVRGQPDRSSGWGGITVYTTNTQWATPYNPVRFEATRLAATFRENQLSAVATGIGIYIDEQNFFQFALNSGSPAKWQWAGMVNGSRFVGEAHSPGSTNTTAYRFRLDYDGSTVQCYVDGYLITTVGFEAGGRGVHGSLLVSPGYVTASSCELSVTYDDFVTTGMVANAPSTAEAEAATITAIPATTRWDTRVTMPSVAAGFHATLVSMQPAGYLDENGVILKRDSKDVTIKARVKVYDERNDRYVLTPYMTMVLQSAYTPALLHDDLAAGKLPNQTLGGEAVKGLQNPFIDETRLRLPRTTYTWTSPDNDLYCPTLPDGFVAELVASSDLSVITLDGKVIPPAVETAVTVRLKITQVATGVSNTRPYTVTVPAKSGHGEWDNYKDSKVGMFIHYVNGQLYSNGTAAYDKDEMANAFDVKGVVASAVKWQVDYIQLTVWHGDWIVLYPSEVQKAYGMTRYTNRDLIGELLDEMDAANKQYGTHLQLYLYTHPGQGVALHAVDKHSVGWGDYDAYNTYLTDIYYELVSRYTNRANGKLGLSGLYFDEGSPQGDMDLFIDYPRLRDACKRAYSDLVMVQNYYQNLYSQDVPNHEVWPAAGTPYSISFRTTDVNGWEAYDNGGYSIVLTGGWNPSSAVTGHSVVTEQYTLYNMFRYTVLLSSVNTQGGGVAWAFSNYAQSANSTQLWETGVDETMTAYAAYYSKYRESLYGTVPGQAYVTEKANGVTNLARVAQTGANRWGVSTDSKDGKTTYLHVLFPPSGNVLELGTPANGVTFSHASLLGRSGEVKLEQTAAGGYRLTLPQGFAWDSIDTVIALTVESDEPAVDTPVASATKDKVTFEVYEQFDGHKLVVNGADTIPAWTDLAIWDTYKDTIATLVIGEGITTIGSNAFAGLSALESVEFASTVTTLQYGAFMKTGLKALVLPNTVKTMGKWVFANCKKLTSVTLGTGFKTLPARTFSGCTALKQVELGTKIALIDDYAFNQCGIEELYLPANVKTIDNAAFYKNTSLRTVEIADGGATYLGWASFYGCASLETIDLGNNLNAISTWVFTACNSLKEITIPDSVTNLGRCTFKWCAALEKVTVGAGVTTIKEEMFAGCPKLNEVILSDNVTSIGSKVFYKCRALTAVVIPLGCEVASNAFLNSGVRQHA